MMEGYRVDKVRYINEEARTMESYIFWTYEQAAECAEKMIHEDYEKADFDSCYSISRIACNNKYWMSGYKDLEIVEWVDF